MVAVILGHDRMFVIYMFYRTLMKPFKSKQNACTSLCVCVGEGNLTRIAGFRFAQKQDTGKTCPSCTKWPYIILLLQGIL
jgi:hypothetical protein